MILLSSSMTALCTNDCLKKNICCRKNLIRVILGAPVLTYWEFTGKVFANKVYMKNGTTQDSYSYRSILCPVQTLYSPCQSSQVDLLGKSEICNGAAVSRDTAGITPLGGSGGMLPQKILKNASS